MRRIGGSVATPPWGGGGSVKPRERHKMRFRGIDWVALDGGGLCAVPDRAHAPEGAGGGSGGCPRRQAVAR